MAVLVNEFVPGVAAPQGSKKAFVNKRTGRVNLVESSARVRPWRQTLAAALTGYTPTDSPVEVRLVFWLPRSKTVRRELPTVKPDVDKLARAVLDELTGAVIRDDAQVVTLTVFKRYADDTHAGVQILVSEAPAAERTA